MRRLGLLLPLILLGSIPAALLALACDAALGEIERALDPTRPRRAGLRDALAVSATLLLVAMGLYGAWGESGSGARSRTAGAPSADPSLSA